MGFNAGWLVQGEGPPEAVFSPLKRIIYAARSRPEDVAFYFCHWVTDLAGAEPTPFTGAEKFAVKFPLSVLQSLLASFPSVHRLADHTETEAYQDYLVDRWSSNPL